eukprot:gene3352-6024_t
MPAWSTNGEIDVDVEVAGEAIGQSSTGAGKVAASITVKKELVAEASYQLAKIKTRGKAAIMSCDDSRTQMTVVSSSQNVATYFATLVLKFFSQSSTHLQKLLKDLEQAVKVEMFRQRQTKLAIKKLYQRNQQLQKAFRQHQTFAQPSTHRQFLTHDHSQRAMSDSISLSPVTPNRQALNHPTSKLLSNSARLSLRKSPATMLRQTHHYRGTIDGLSSTRGIGVLSPSFITMGIAPDGTPFQKKSHLPLLGRFETPTFQQ